MIEPQIELPACIDDLLNVGFFQSLLDIGFELKVVGMPK
jgi:hypothetical protein